MHAPAQTPPWRPPTPLSATVRARLAGLLCLATIFLAAGTAAAQSTGSAAAAELQVISPRPGEPATTTRDHVHVLGRTAPGASVRVAGVAVTVFATGVFARDRVPLQPGANSILIEARLADGQTLQLPLQVERTSAPPTPAPRAGLWLDSTSLRPAEAVMLAPGEAVEVAVRASAGQHVEARLPGQPDWQALVERRDGTGAGHYRTLLAFAGTEEVAAGPVQVRLRPAAAAAAKPAGAAARAAPGATRQRRPRLAVAQDPLDSTTSTSINASTSASVGQWRADPERLYAVGPEGAELLHGLHEVRLGGPYLAELPAGTLLAATGRRGDFLRVQLAPDTTAWVADKQVVRAAAGTPAPQAVFTSVSVSGAGPAGGASADSEIDVVNVPLAARVPYAVHAHLTPEGRLGLDIDIYGAQLATTWLSHRASSTLVRQLTVEQAGAGRVRLRVLPHLQDAAPRIWGWRVERSAGALRVLLRAAPRLSAQAASPLAGLRVAVEAGHGSSANLGAVGATGVPEKDINRWTAEALQAELEAAGAQVVVVREGDDNPNLRERARRVAESQAHLFVSVHANAADTGAGFLRVAGTSTLYKHPPHHALAAAVQKRVLAATALDDFGVVGNFNYTPVRLSTWAPAVLVEQAFVSHPGDEAQLLDAAFRARLAQAVRAGLEDFLRPR